MELWLSIFIMFSVRKFTLFEIFEESTDSDVVQSGKMSLKMHK